ncbi:MAG TPA: DNA polymerase III subunit delta [Casimicrobiaceae bacterium]
MTQLRPDELDAHLAKTLAPLYVVHGDEPLFAMEAGDAIRAAARRAGCDEREVFIVEPHFRWDAFVAANANLGLFASRKLVDLRIPSGKPGADGAAILERHANDLPADNVTLVTLPRLDRAAQSSAWFTALTEHGVVVPVVPIDRKALPGWIAARLARNRQKVGRDTLAFLAERCEGNLLAAKQEIDKLALLLPPGLLEHDDVERAVANVARYDIQELSEAWLAGDAARTLRIVEGLRGEGEPVTLVAWQLAEDLHALSTVHDAVARGTSVSTAVRTARVWGKRLPALERAVRRVGEVEVSPLLAAAAKLDALAKGIGRGDPWDLVVDIGLAVCGKRLPTPI